jgi:hypothetical protein
VLAGLDPCWSQTHYIGFVMTRLKYFYYFQAMWLMLQLDKPEDFVISMNESHSVREFVLAAFKKVDIDIV